MKALSLARPLLIMVIGLPGAGKSFFARHFADTFGAPMVSADRVRFELFENPQYNQTENGLIKRLIEQQLTELVKTKNTLLVDGICNSRIERQQLAQFANAHDYGTLVVWVQTDEPTAKTRATQRSSKRQGDEYNTRVSADQFATLSKRFTAPEREDYVVISGKHTYTTQAKMVLRKLSAPRVEQAAEAYQSQTEQSRTSSVPARRNIILR